MAISTPNTSGVRDDKACWRSWFSAARRRPDCRRAGPGGSGRWWPRWRWSTGRWWAPPGRASTRRWSAPASPRRPRRCGPGWPGRRAAGRPGRGPAGCRGAGPERRGDLVVADPGVGRGRHDGDRRHVGPQPDHRRGGRQQQREGGQGGGHRVAPQPATPGVHPLLEPADRMVMAGREAAEADPSGVDPGAEPSEHGGQQGQGGGQDGDDRQHDAEGHRPEGRARHEQDGGQRGEHGEGGEGDGLAGGVHRLGHRGADPARSPGWTSRRSRAARKRMTRNRA